MQTSFTTEQKQEDWLQEFIDEWKEEARKIGVKKGTHLALVNICCRLLKKRFNEVPDSINVQINELSVSQLEKLSVDLLDFNEIGDFDNWLIKNSN